MFFIYVKENTSLNIQKKCKIKFFIKYSGTINYEDLIKIFLKINLGFFVRKVFPGGKKKN
jgi:hypothetical protein